MANDFTSNPLILDTAMVGGYQAQSGVPNGLMLYPRVIRWDAPVAAGDQFQIEDSNGNILFKATCAANGQGEDFEVAEGVRWEDLWTLSLIDSGTLYIYFTT